MSGLLDFLSAEAGQRRTRARDEAIENVFSWLLGPTGIPDRLNAIGLLNPVQDIYEAGGNARDGDYAGAAINTASALMPVVGAKLAGGGLADDAANIISDTLTNVGTRAQGAMDAGQAFAADEFGGVGPSKGIRAYHGSPHDFDRFSMDAIGTGEGAQAYGHGLYFAENEAVARGYRDRISGAKWVDRNGLEVKTNDIVEDISKEARKAGFGVVEADEMAFNWRDYLSNPDTAPSPIKSVLKQKGIRLDGQGRMYEVNINANPDDFLDWDAPLSEQSSAVQRLAQSAGVADVAPEWRFNGYDGGYFRKTETGSKKIGEVRHLGGNEYRAKVGRDELGVFSSPESARAAIDRALVERGGAQGALQMRGSDVYDRIVGGIDSLVHSSPRRPEATAQMREAGIPGIKYKDAGSRGADGGTRNFVVFDENLIEIVRKYGIAGAAAITGLSVAEIEGRMNGT